MVIREPLPRGEPQGQGSQTQGKIILPGIVALVEVSFFDHPDTPHPLECGGIHTCQNQPDESQFNHLRYTMCCGNQHQPYPLLVSVQSHTDRAHHVNE